MFVMSTRDKEKFTREVEAFIRDIKLNSILDDNLSIVKHKKTLFNFFWKGWKVIDELYNIGGTITGSTALSMYRYKGHPIINRKPNDFDFILNKENFRRFCGLKNISDIEIRGGNMRLSLKTGIIFYSNYGDTNIFNHDIDCITDDNFDRFKEYNGIKIANLDYIIEQKLKLFNSGGELEKNFKDLHMIMSRFKFLENA
jgi:hypothetical protein